MITRIEAYKYRCFNTLDLALEQQHVFAGSNGSGKTTLLDIPALFSDLLNVTDINDAFFKATNGRKRARAENAIEIVHQLRGDYFMLAVEIKLPESIVDELMRDPSPTWLKKFEIKELRPDTARYELSIRIKGGSLEVSEEHLTLFPDNSYRVDHGSGLIGVNEYPSKWPWFKVISRSWGEKVQYCQEFQTKKSTILEFGLRDNQLALAALPADHDLYPAALWVQGFLLQGAHCYEPQWSAMRLAASPRDKECFKSDGSSLPWQVYDLQEKDPEGLEEWLEIVQMALPSISKIEGKKRSDDSYCYLEVTYSNGMKVPSSGLSHGTLHILALTIIPYLQSAPQIITLEEPENGIHPKAIDAVLEALKLSSNTQIWLSTHSPVVLANTVLEQIISMRFNKDGATEVLKGNEHPRLKEWKGEVDLGSLFAAGVLE
ncbi:ATP-binding protein [Alginatibacterium sediminis]|uniref:ATP-binding protein n=1 Tax=Alginatibacterium sediminis TaxID=2164068 RepID=A0A420EHL7_9ALTE|nr:AAA family ATPase [Alginatibacterium sediminis]RKF20173.1 ATP-binding protein [Alginatibacterium sediminis]